MVCCFTTDFLIIRVRDFLCNCIEVYIADVNNSPLSIFERGKISESGTIYVRRNQFYYFVIENPLV